MISKIHIHPVHMGPNLNFPVHMQVYSIEI